MIFCARATRGRGPPRWTRAVEDQSAPTPWERASKLGRIILGDGSRSMRAVKGSLGHSPKERGEIRREQSRINQATVEEMGKRAWRDGEERPGKESFS